MNDTGANPARVEGDDAVSLADDLSGAVAKRNDPGRNAGSGVVRPLRYPPERVGIDDFNSIPSNGNAPVVGEPSPWPVMSHDDFLDLNIKEEPALIEALITRGSLGTIVGLPESCKSWLAQEIAMRVARGEGEILGRRVCSKGTVLYCFEDDSVADQQQRIRLYDEKHATRGLPLNWLVNANVEFPKDIERLAGAIEFLGVDLLIIDSFYNFTRGVDLVAPEAGEVVVQLKQRIGKGADCAVAIVDHMPHRTDKDRSRLRSYGSVFKGAAVRWGVYIDTSKPQWKIEIRGNNIPPLKPTGVRFNPETLLLELDNSPAESDEWKPTWLMEKASRYIEEHEPVSRNQVLMGIYGKSTDHKRQAIDFLVRDGYVVAEDGPRNAKLLRSVKPYRENAETVAEPVAVDGDEVPF